MVLPASIAKRDDEHDASAGHVAQLGDGVCNGRPTNAASITGRFALVAVQSWAS